ncbi:hypothetical protein PG997_001761 [Apiospora hydei]|uniref:Protein kinase domain-containing protein n=1 Tax=Apiospora hydei TaxID=1337664 RepID=A0ABR1XEE9_9PEZI
MESPVKVASDFARQFFAQDSGVTLEGIEGSGWRTLRLRLKVNTSRLSFRKYMMHMAFEDPPPSSLERDTLLLQDLQYVIHVVKLVALSNEPTPTPEPKNFKPVFNPFKPDGLKYEHYLIEHEPNGSLEQLITRMEEDEKTYKSSLDTGKDADDRERIPNRLLIRIFLCAARACAAMAWLPGPGRDRFGYLLPEEARNDVDPTNYVHGAIRPNHWLFGQVDGHTEEHSLVPIMKLAGFDEAYVHNGEEADIENTPEFDQKSEIVCRTRPVGKSNAATRVNILNVGVLMGNIILEDNQLLTADEVRKELGPKGQWSRTTHPGYDPELVELVARCLAVEPNSRPTIQELLDTLRTWLFQKTGTYYAMKPGDKWETDVALRQLIQRYRARTEQQVGISECPLSIAYERSHLEGDLPGGRATLQLGDYIALSYEWGDPARTGRMVVNGIEITVTRNLQDALRDTCTKWWDNDDYSEEIHFWADAVCINQLDVSERNHQIKLMGEIYTQALRVWAWTGPGLEYDEAALKLLNEFRVAAVEGPCHCKMCDCIILLGFSNPTDRACAVRRGSPIYCSSCTAGALAQQKDERDKVYGLLSLMDPDIHNAVKVDYNKPYPIVYQEFARCVVEKTGRLDLIYQLAADCPSQGEHRAIGDGASESEYFHLPSWVPDWSSLASRHGSGDYRDPFMNRWKKNAGSHTEHMAQKEAHKSHLTCKGTLLDTVDGLGCSRDARLRHNGHDIITPTHLSNASPVTKDPRMMKNAVWGTITMGTVMDGDTVNPKSIGEVLDFSNLHDDNCIGDDGMVDEIMSPAESRIIQWHRCNQLFEVFGLPLHSFFEELPPKAYRKRAISSATETMYLHGVLANVLAFRRIVTTAKGYVGMAPKTSRQGDSIFLLKGCDAPLVLRLNGDGTYYLVGEIYVHGIMDVEAMDQFLQDGSVEEMDVVLR